MASVNHPPESRGALTMLSLGSAAEGGFLVTGGSGVTSMVFKGEALGATVLSVEATPRWLRVSDGSNRRVWRVGEDQEA